MTVCQHALMISKTVSDAAVGFANVTSTLILGHKR